MRQLFSTSFGLLLALSLAVSPVLAQQTHSSSLTLPETVSASELNAAAQLYAEIETIYAIHETKLMRANTADAKATIKTKREQAIETAIQNAPLSAKQYTSILQQADENQSFNKRLKNRLRQARDQQGTTTADQSGPILDTESSKKQQCTAGPSSKSSTE